MADLSTVKWRVGFKDGSGESQVRTDEATEEFPDHTGDLVCDANENSGCGCCGGSPEEADIERARQFSLLPDLYRAADKLLDNPGCADPDCCDSSIKNEECRKALRALLKEINPC